MTDKSNNTAVPTNEEIINDLTKDLQSNTTLEEEQEEFNSNQNEHEESLAEKGDAPKSVEEDYIDEEALKDVESSLTPEELEKRRQKAAELKTQGNDQFKNELYLESVQTYTDALLLCPLSRTEERSVLYCNRAAGKLKAGRKQSAIDDCTKAIELNEKYVRAYLRRAKLYEETDKLEESLADFKKVLEFDPGQPDARSAAVRLPPIITERNEKLKAEMLGKLKDLGNMILKPFGLSTENFKLQQDPNSGGYSVNFQR